jgi:type I restriction enzyme S subunit
MIWNDELKREIPEGWKMGCLGDISNITMGSSPKGESLNENGDGMLFYQGKTDFGHRFPSARVYTTSPIRYAEQNDILLSVRAPVGSINVAIEKCSIGRGLAAINSNYRSYVYYMLLCNQFQFDKYNDSGTTFGSINKDDLHDIKVLIPKDEILMLFESKIKIFDEVILNNEKQNKELSSLRDFLLPMLMNGQVGFKND